MTDSCHIDIESFSRINLKQCGLYRYAESDTTEILVVCYAFGGDPVSTWAPYKGLPTEIVEAMHAHHEEIGGEFIVGPQVPFEIEAHAMEGGEFRAHNSEFERVMLNGLPGRAIGFPKTELEQWVCTSAKMAVHGLPRALGNAAKALRSPHQKNEEGRMTMMQVIKTRKPSKAIPEDRWTPWNSPDRFIGLYKYCVDDVESERAIDLMVPDLTPSERDVYLMDQRINARGVRVDLEGNANVKRLRDERKIELRETCKTLSGFTPSQTGKLGAWIRERYPPLINLQDATMKKALKDPKMPDIIREVVRARMLHELKAVAKCDAIERMTCSDERLHGQFLYYGAGTGRWSSLGVQLQNLARPVISDAYVALEACEARDLEWLRILYNKDPMLILSSTIRSLLLADPGHELLCLDYSSIEGRITAWLAGQEDKLQIFRTHGKVYEYTGAKMFRLPTDLDFLMDMKREHPDERFAGKTGELACGFQGGPKAFRKMAAKFEVDIDEGRAIEIVREWREANPRIVEMWYALEEYAIQAVARPGHVFKTHNIAFGISNRNPDWLYMKLPSGRRLAYYKPELDVEGKLTYLGIDTYTRQWGRVKTYGGRLTENAVQATARDIMVNGMFKLEAKSYPIVGTVHDEIIMEPQMGFGSVDEAAELMCDTPDWAEGLPVAADGFRAKRYRKDD